MAATSSASSPSGVQRSTKARTTVRPRSSSSMVASCAELVSPPGGCRAVGLAQQLQDEPEPAALPRLAEHTDLSAVRFHDLLGDEQPQARPAGRRPRHAEVFLEDRLLVLGGDARSLVADLE